MQRGNQQRSTEDSYGFAGVTVDSTLGIPDDRNLIRNPVSHQDTNKCRYKTDERGDEDQPFLFVHTDSFQIRIVRTFRPRIF